MALGWVVRIQFEPSWYLSDQAANVSDGVRTDRIEAR
jgi:hypothetical protein